MAVCEASGTCPILENPYRGASAAGGSSIAARTATSGASGTVMNPRAGRSRSKLTKSSSVSRAGGEQDGDDAAREHREIERQQRERDGGTDHLDERDRRRHAVVERRHARRLHVDHLVQALDVQARRRLVGCASSAWPARRQSWRWSADSVAIARFASGAAGHRGRARGSRRCTLVERQRAATNRLSQRLRPQVRRPDRVGVVHDGGAAGVVAADRHRQAEREDEADQRQECALDDAERLAQRLA